MVRSGPVKGGALSRVGPDQRCVWNQVGVEWSQISCPPVLVQGSSGGKSFTNMEITLVMYTLMTCVYSIRLYRFWILGDQG